MLTAREADLLRMLCEHKGQIVRREVILSRLWNTEEDYFASRILAKIIMFHRDCPFRLVTINALNEKVSWYQRAFGFK